MNKVTRNKRCANDDPAVTYPRRDARVVVDIEDPPVGRHRLPPPRRERLLRLGRHHDGVTQAVSRLGCRSGRGRRC